MVASAVLVDDEHAEVRQVGDEALLRLAETLLDQLEALLDSES